VGYHFIIIYPIANMITDEIIARATDSVNKVSESSRTLFCTIDVILAEIPTLLNRLLEPDSQKNEWIGLFCRQLKRLMDSNDSLSEFFWIDLRDDILCILNEPSDGKSMVSNWNRFLARMNFEEKLEQREFQLKQNIGERKSLSELFSKHNEFFKGYLQKCISLHSKVQVQGLIENIDDLLCRVYGLTEICLSSDSRKNLGEKLKSVEIPLDWFNRSLNSLDSQFSINDNSSEAIDNDLGSFLPSKEIHINTRGNAEVIENVLGSSRWIVILGDPGSAKTTLFRWITHVFVEAADRSDDKVNLEGSYDLPLRIPI
jgi:hypothetical protein